MAARKKRTVRLSGWIHRTSESDECAAADVPDELKRALKAWKAGKATERDVLPIAQKYVVANFVPENLSDADELFSSGDDVEGLDVAVDALFLEEGRLLPKVSASAVFVVAVKAAFPADEEALAQWQEDNTPLTDAVNFFWRFGDTELVLGEVDEAGVDFEDAAQTS